MKNKKIIRCFAFLLLFVFMISFVSAAEWDNVLDYKLNEDKITIRNALGLPNWLGGSTLVEATLESNGCDENERYCEAIKTIKLNGEMALVQDFRTFRLDDSSNRKENIRWHKLEYWGEIEDYETQCVDGITIISETNKTSYTPQICNQIKIGSHEGWIIFYEGDIFQEGTYQVKTSGEIKPGRVYDWQIKFAGEWTTPWATWGNISLGDEAEVILNNPTNGSISLVNPVTFNCSANVTGGATLINISLFTNQSGVWEAKNTTEISIFDAGLVSYYKLDDDLATTNIIDSLGVNDGTLIGGDNTEDKSVAGKINLSQKLNGFDDSIDLLSNIGTDIFSASLWFKRDGAIVSDRIILNRWDTTEDGSENRYLVGFNGDTNLSAFVGSDAGWRVIEAGLDTNYHHLVMIYTGSVAQFYLDGVSKLNITTTYSESTGAGDQWTLGRFSTSTGEFNGTFDEVGFWNRTLTNSEISDFYNFGNGSRPLSPSTQTWNTTITDSTLWTCQACDSDDDCGFAPSNFTVNLDVGAPTITVQSPNGTLDYNFIGNNETLNVTFTDSNLDFCWFDYNGTNITIDGCLTGVKNSTQFILELDNTNMTIYANDSLGNENSTFIEWNYRILEINQTFDSPVVELSTQEFELFIESGETITAVSFIYNGTTYSSNIFDLGSELFRITSTIQIPSFDIDVNTTFHFNISLLSGPTISTQEQTQEVSVLFVGNCSAFSNLLLNLSLFDEKLLDPIEGTIEVDISILNSDGVTELSSKSTQFYNISTASVCSNINLTEGGYLYNLELRYYVDPLNNSNFQYVPEFYHIQKAETSNFPQEINLYDLNINESTEFTIFYRDNNYIARENVLLQIQRKYVDEGIFRTIEIPITSSEGSAIGHFDLNNYKYKVTVTFDGEVLNVFDNPAVRCESELSGICEITLKGLAEVPQADFTSDIEDFFFTLDQTEDSVIVSYSIPSGESSNVHILMTQTSPFKDSTVICNTTVLSSAGQTECDVNQTIGDSNVIVRIESGDEPKGNLKVTFQEDLNTDFLLNNYFIAIILLMTIIMMVVSSPQLMVIASIFGLAFSGFVFLLKYETIGLAAGAVGWLIVAGIIILVKLNKKAEQ